METRIFFNPGDSIANIHDYNEAVRKGQIFKKERKIDDLVIAKVLMMKNMPSFMPRTPCRPITPKPSLMTSRSISSQIKTPSQQADSTFFIE